MIKELSIKNFRSIREATLELGRITVLNGANNSGKSSVLYALQVLQNAMYKSGQPVDEFFNFKFVNLGGLKESTFKKNLKNSVGLKILVAKGEYKCSFQVDFNEIEGHTFSIKGIRPFSFQSTLSVTFPYTQNKIQKVEIENNPDIDFSWNGIRPSRISVNGNSAHKIPLITEEAISPLEAVIRIDLIPTQRGFSTTTFTETPILDLIYEEVEVASILLKDFSLQEKVNYYFEKATGMSFQVHRIPQAGFFFLHVSEKDGNFWTELVNQGMGVNQILFMLAKILYDKNRLICIDEPEIHLHPTLIEQFVKVLVEIAHQEDKQFIFSTHSEHWLMSLLAEVNDGNLKAEELKVYYLTKEGQETKIENQEVHPNGQIEGGLKNFLEAQLRLSNRFFDAQTA